MNPYILTVAFLMLMSFVTSSEVIRFSLQNREKGLFESSIESAKNLEELAMFGKLENFIVQEPVEDLTPDKTTKTREKKGFSKKSTFLGYNLDRPPQNSRLNFFQIFQPSSMSSSLPEGFSLYESAAYLMRMLYEKADFYYKNIEYHILDELLRQKESLSSFQDPEMLQTLCFEDKEVQSIFCRMLKGDENFPSLLHYITLDTELSQRGSDRQINLMFVSNELLQALFPNRKEVALKLIEAREQIWQEIFEQEKQSEDKSLRKGRREFKKMLTQTCERVFQEAHLPPEDYKRVFDFGLGKYGKVLFVKDSKTGIIKREKIPSCIR